MSTSTITIKPTRMMLVTCDVNVRKPLAIGHCVCALLPRIQHSTLLAEENPCSISISEGIDI
jgi:hypothetical protein